CPRAAPNWVVSCSATEGPFSLSVFPGLAPLSTSRPLMFAAPWLRYEKWGSHNPSRVVPFQQPVVTWEGSALANRGNPSSRLDSPISSLETLSLSRIAAHSPAFRLPKNIPHT